MARGNSTWIPGRPDKVGFCRVSAACCSAASTVDNPSLTATHCLRQYKRDRPSRDGHELGSGQECMKQHVPGVDPNSTRYPMANDDAVKTGLQKAWAI